MIEVVFHALIGFVNYLRILTCFVKIYDQLPEDPLDKGHTFYKSTTLLYPEKEHYEKYNTLQGYSSSSAFLDSQYQLSKQAISRQYKSRRMLMKTSDNQETLSVRFLTRRYIGEYDHKSETRYKHEVLVDNESVLYEILDTCPKSIDDLPTTDTFNWADGLLLVYSITDRCSISYLRRVGSLIANSDIPLYIVANKNDMIHLREVTAEEGAVLARTFECGFSEVAAAEMVAPVAVVFQELCRAVLASRRKSKHSLLERIMLGTKPGSLRLYARGKSDSALPKD